MVQFHCGKFGTKILHQKLHRLASLIIIKNLAETTKLFDKNTILKEASYTAFETVSVFVGLVRIIHINTVFPHPVSSINNRLYYDFSTSLTKIEKQSILIY